MKWNWLARIVNRAFPLAKEVEPGYGPFALDSSSALGRAALTHDFETGEAIKNKSKSDYDKADIRFCYQVILQARAEAKFDRPERALNIIYDLIDFFPVMRKWAAVRTSEFV